MGRRILFAAFLGTATAVSDPVEQAFEDFINSFGKEYSSQQERRTRLGIFRENFALIQAENAKGLPYTLEANMFADQTPEEFQATHLGLRKGLVPGSQWGGLPRLGVQNYSGAPLPQSVDWTTKGAVTAVKNQQQCGSCWAFSSTGSLEGAWQIATGNLVALSEQQLIDCSHNGNQGCGGGEMDAAFKFLESNGVCSEESWPSHLERDRAFDRHDCPAQLLRSYPYESKDDTCRESSCTVAIPKGSVVGFKDVAIDDDQALMEAVAQQPVSVAIEADQMAFQLYKGGILTKKCGDSLDHGVLVVGYGSEGGVDFWKVKNSWGPSWGEQGYVRLERGGKGPGECGVKQQPSFPVVKKSPTPPAPAPPSPPSPPVPPTPATSHYEAPPCRSDEVEARLEGASGVFCAPPCGWFGRCPQDVPQGTTAKPRCALRSQQGSKYCALPCQTNNVCPKGASCVQLTGAGICLYPESKNQTLLLSFAEDAQVVI